MAAIFLAAYICFIAPVATANNTVSSASTLSEGTSYHYVCDDDDCTYGVDEKDYLKFQVYNGDRYKVQLYNDCPIHYAAASFATSQDGSSWGNYIRLDCDESGYWGYNTANSNGNRYVVIKGHDDWSGDQNKIRVVLTIEKSQRNRDFDGFIDSEDDCKYDYGSSNQQFKGCLDSDGDGWANINDACPYDSSEHLDSDDDNYCDGDDWAPNDGTQWVDADNDGYGDNAWGNQGDKFPSDRTQWFDNDDDGYGDNQDGNNPDDCRFTYGKSFNDRRGCPDSDGDGWSDPDSDHPAHPTGSADAFPYEYEEWMDSDEDNYGDNADMCPQVFGTSGATISELSEPSTYGVLALEQATFNYPSNTNHNQIEAKADILYSNINAVWGDEIPIGAGSSQGWIIWQGCLDSDGDGFADVGDKFPNNPTQWSDADGDGFGDNLPHPTFNDPTYSPSTCQSELRSSLNSGQNEDLRRGEDLVLCTFWSASSTTEFLVEFTEDGRTTIPFSSASRYFHYGDFDIGFVIPGATNGDACPMHAGTSTNDRLGCPDFDKDGWSDPDSQGESGDKEGWVVADGADQFIFDTTQYIDTDGDGYGDDPDGFQGDSCPMALGASTRDRYGCPDSDGDGYSDMNGFFATTTSKAFTDGDPGSILLIILPFAFLIAGLVYRKSKNNQKDDNSDYVMHSQTWNEPPAYGGPPNNFDQPLSLSGHKLDEHGVEWAVDQNNDWYYRESNLEPWTLWRG